MQIGLTEGGQNRKPVLSFKELKLIAKSFNINSLLKSRGYRNRPLDFQQAYVLGAFTLFTYKQGTDNQSMVTDVFGIDRDTAEKQSIAALCAFHNMETYRKDGAAEQVAGVCAAVFDYDIRLSRKGFLKPNLNCVMDNSGMGGDLFRTPNVSTIAALIVASDGIIMCKHGSPGNTDSVGSSDLMAHLGANLFPGRQVVESSLETLCFGYTDALDTGYKGIHIQTHQSARLAHMNDVIGPVTNPIEPFKLTKRVLGVNHLLEPEVMAQAYAIMNEKGVTNMGHCLAVRGFVSNDRNGGIDEVSIFPGGTRVAELRDGRIRVFELTADDFGVPAREYVEPPKEKAEFGQAILLGQISGPMTELCLANAAVLYHLAKGLSFADGFERAKQVLEEKLPMKLVSNYVNFTKR